MSVIVKEEVSLISRLMPIILGVGLMALATQVAIPLEPVQITMHTVAMLLIAFCFEPSKARQVMFSYVALGALGMPLFKNFGSAEVLIGPSGGYYFGMLAGTYVISHAREFLGEGNWLYKQVLAVVGLFFVYLIGVVQLSLFVGVSGAITLGLLPFIKTGIVKAVFTSYSIHFIKSGRR